jgi:hypothetical protein
LFAQEPTRKRGPTAGPFQPYEPVVFTEGDVTNPKGALGSKMPLKKGPGLDGFRLEHIRDMTLACPEAAEAMAAFTTWMACPHGTPGEPTDNFLRIIFGGQILPFRKPGAPGPRPVTPPSALLRGLERVIDCRYRDAFAEAAGPLQFGYCAPAGTDQAVMLMRILRELFPDNAVLLCDVAKAFNSLSKEAVFEALEEWPKLRSLVPYARRKANTSPLLVYYANGRFDGMPPTAFLRMLDGFIQGHTLSSPFFAITLTYALKKVRETHVPHTLLECFADDTSGGADTQKVAPMVKDIGEALEEEAGVHLSCPKTKIVLPTARTAADVAVPQ